MVHVTDPGLCWKLCEIEGQEYAADIRAGIVEVCAAMDRGHWHGKVLTGWGSGLNYFVRYDGEVQVSVTYASYQQRDLAFQLGFNTV